MWVLSAQISNINDFDWLCDTTTPDAGWHRGFPLLFHCVNMIGVVFDLLFRGLKIRLGAAGHGGFPTVGVVEGGDVIISVLVPVLFLAEIGDVVGDTKLQHTSGTQMATLDIRVEKYTSNAWGLFSRMASQNARTTQKSAP